MSSLIELVFRALVFPGFIFIALFTMFCDWVERKMEARMQNRMGPTYTGPAGILQPFADFLKLLMKENIVPKDAKVFVFKFAPILALSVFVFATFFLPIDGANAIPNSGFEGDLIFVMTLVSIANFFLFLSGWASANPYSATGAARILTQFLAYDIPLFILALTPAFLASSISISKIAASQSIPFILLIPWSFILFLIVLQAELEKNPFDVPAAETEIVGGYETEYAGLRLAFVKFSGDVQIVLGAGIAVELFLGGPSGPVLFGLPVFWHAFWFVLKTLVVVIITEYITCVFARLRIDHVLAANWRVFMPISILSLALTVAAYSWLNLP